MAKKWSDEEKAVLREVSQSDLTLMSQMHRLPGRTHTSARHYASRVMKLPLRSQNPWSPEEREILRGIYSSTESIKHAVARLLPHRTYPMAKSEAMRLRITRSGQRRTYGYSVLFRQIELILAGGHKASVRELAQQLNVSIGGVDHAMRRQHGTHVRIAGYRRAANGGLAALWALGTGADAPRPERKSSTEACREYRARLRVKAGAINPWAGLAA
jgi:hypothetical protein